MSSITDLIIEQKGDYVLGLKRNHPKLYKAIDDLIIKAGENNKNRLFNDFEHSHGRTMRRRYFGYDVRTLPEIQEWSGGQRQVKIE
jgi:hypothetical protein